MQELIDMTIDRYRIERGLARGGMSEVYLAEDTQTGQMVAMKLVKRTVGEYYERFRREAKVMLKLRHAHILPALDYGEYDDWSYMITPYIEYGTLATRLNQGPIDINETRLILDQLAEALQYAHDHGILHRDIKASNVLLRDGTYAYLTDFGLVKSIQDEYSLTRSGFLIGTPEYMAPELVENPATPLSDIYALGILLYQMLTGILPFRGVNPVAIVMKHLREEPIPPSRINPAIPLAVEQVVLLTLEKDPQRRFHTARALANAFRQACGFEAISVPPVPVLAVEQMPTEQVGVKVVPDTSSSISTPSPFPKRVGIIIMAAILVILLLLLSVSRVFGASVDFAPSQHSRLPASAITAIPSFSTINVESIQKFHDKCSKSSSDQ
jgi:serine/threonine protein kinase